MLKKLTLLLILFLLRLTSHGQSHGSGPGLIYINGGISAANVHTDATFEVSPEVLEYYPEANTSLSLENDLKFPVSNDMMYIKGIVGSRIQLALTYYKLHRSGEANLTRTFAFGDNTYTVSAPVSGYFNTDYYSGSVRFSFIYTPIVTAGLSLGARYLKMSAGIHADSMGYVFDKSGDMNVPVAVPGIHASVYAIPGLLIRGSLEYFSLKISGTKGQVFETNVSAEYYLLKYLGVGIGYSMNHLKAEGLPDNPIYLKDVNYRVDGVNIFAAFRF
jgi:hypothetical protein